MANNLHQAQSHDILRFWQSQRNNINHHKDFVLPMFIGNNDDATEPIESMPEVFRYGCNTAVDYLEPLVNKYGLRSVLLFPVITKTDQIELEDEGDQLSEDECGNSSSSSSSSSDGRSSSSASHSTLENSLSSDDELNNDAGPPPVSRAGGSFQGEVVEKAGNSSPSLNPFISNQNETGEEEEDHLLAGEQGEPTNGSASILGAPVPKRPPRLSVHKLLQISKNRDIKLIKGMALKERHNPVLRLIPKLRQKFPQLLIICDVCLCAFTSTGHCCLFESNSSSNGKNHHQAGGARPMGNFQISKKTTCQYLALLAVEYAQRGCDVVAPSDMMDGRILTIREKLNDEGLLHVSIMSYSAKFASAFYGPFRQATNNAPEFGDRRGYQLPPGSRPLASKAVQRDIEQGADFVMVKPGGLYLDIVRDIKERHPDVPVAIYQVSGEYSMLKLAAQNGLIDLKLALAEVLTAFRRAGASIIISYFTPEILKDEHLASIS